MAESAHKNRPSKRPQDDDVITIDDDEPATKSAKREAEPSPEVVELQRKLNKSEQKVAKLEKKKEKLIKWAGELKERAEFLEKIADEKPDLTDIAKKKDELEKKVSDMERERVDERAAEDRRTVVSAARVAGLERELQNEREATRQEQQKVAAMMQELDQLRAAAVAANTCFAVLTAQAAELDRLLKKEREERRREQNIRRNSISSIEQQVYAQLRDNTVLADRRSAVSAAQAAAFERELKKEREERRQEQEAGKNKFSEIVRQCQQERVAAAEAKKQATASAAHAAKLEISLQTEREGRRIEQEKVKDKISIEQQSAQLCAQLRSTVAEAQRCAAASHAQATQLERELKKERDERREEEEKSQKKISSIEQQSTMLCERLREAAAEAGRRAVESAEFAAHLENSLQTEREVRRKEQEEGKEKISSIERQCAQERAAAAEAKKNCVALAARPAELERALLKERLARRTELKEKVSSFEEKYAQLRAAAAAADNMAADSAARAAEFERKLKKERDDRWEEQKKVNDKVASSEKMYAQLSAQSHAAVAAAERNAVALAARAAELEQDLQKERDEREKGNEKVRDLTMKLEEEKGRASEDRKRGLDERISDQARLTSLSNQLVEERRQTNYRVNHVSMQLEEQIRLANEDRKRGLEERMRDHERIHELECRLAHCEGRQQQPPMQQQPPPSQMELLQPLEEISDADHQWITKIYESGDPTNILQLCRSATPSSISIDSAVSILKDFQLCVPSSQMSLDCEICKMKLCNYKILTHFFSEEHIEKVRRSGAGVSKEAVQHWVQVLQGAAADKRRHGMPSTSNEEMTDDGDDDGMRTGGTSDEMPDLTMAVDPNQNGEGSLEKEQ